ncbi:uncharacterized phosphotransferase YvkC-like [Uloborus diversus]|uniref:uncharacterized phosphotransferase YvkC-like n=1 Tax=Uloborus diversus TaxID=327109 RepID=UPI002408FDD2|nr:uncharacterized phosphotransferase YvkC-like [Uloborus diversus]
MSVVQELNSDLKFEDLTTTFSTKSFNSVKEQLLRFRKFQNKYEQWGQLMGTVKLKEENEQELYLWSCRTRIARAFSTTKSTVLLTDELCRSSQIVGGKGCSLILLTHLATKTSEFKVPKGFVITTAAFERHIESNPDVKLAIEELNRATCQKTVFDLQQKCTKCMEVFNSSKLSEDLKQEMKKVLSSLYESLENVRFSVRSSAYGEDSEDLSAAGQMLTVLGVRSLKSIADAVIKCWSSKFSFEAVQYSRQNGQLITSPMAVVVQEMVPSEVSGILFTTDPVTGDPTYPCITANYGLGETVVSALAEPDTIKLKRNVNKSLSVFEKTVGSKKTQVHMTDGDGTEQKFYDSETSSCLTDELAVKIGNVGILIEKCFCGPRDIEWALYRGELFLLQARPITTLHIETDFELIHDQDTPVRSDHEYWTRANTGEVFLGATSPLAVSVVVNGMDINAHRNQIIREFRTQYCPYVAHVLPVTHKQVTISLIDTLFRNNEKEISNNQKAFEVALFGRLVSTKKIHEVGVKRYGYATKARKYLGFLFLGRAMFGIPKAIDKLYKKIDSSVPHFENFIDIPSTWQGILDQFPFQCESMLIKTVNWFRQSFYHLGDLFVQAGLLPEGELIFFLTLEEIQDMMEHRTPGLVPKAIRRRRLHPTLNSLQFPEIIEGIPKPIKEDKDVSKYAASFTLKGTPVCQGKVKATATVVLSLEEASNIKSGDILITHSTDIGWSPYFPLLSGVVTVLGGLISHGNIVAREYGLPCVVGVQKATSAFKSGDIVILDGTSGNSPTKVTSLEEEKLEFD